MGEQPPQPAPGADDFVVPEGIRRSLKALQRDLPELLANRRLHRKWALYHGDVRLGISRHQVDLVRECLRRGLREDEYYIGLIDEMELEDLDDEVELDPRF